MHTTVISPSVAAYTPYVSFVRMGQDMGRLTIKRCSVLAPVDKSVCADKTQQRAVRKENNKQADEVLNDESGIGQNVDLSV